MTKGTVVCHPLWCYHAAGKLPCTSVSERLSERTPASLIWSALAKPDVSLFLARANINSCNLNPKPRFPRPSYLSTRKRNAPLVLQASKHCAVSLGLVRMRGLGCGWLRASNQEPCHHLVVVKTLETPGEPQKKRWQMENHGLCH